MTNVDEQRRRITEDLSGLLEGELRCDALTAALYASDASLFQIEPLGVAWPKSRDDVVTLAKYAVETETPLVPRGAGTGLAGGAIGSGLIVDFSRFMTAIEALSGETVRVQPGVVHEKLNAALRREGRYFPPDPSNSAITTIGGMLGVDSAGSHAVRVGSTRDHVQSIELVLAGGAVLEAEDEQLAALRGTAATVSANEADGSGSAPADSNGRAKRETISRLAALLRAHRALIEQHQPRAVRNCSGYFLRGVLAETTLRLPRLLVGSEGTMGLFTAATLHTAPLPEHRGAVLILFGDMAGAAGTIEAITRQQPSACDLLDRRILNLAREADRRFEELISPGAEAALLVEQTAYNERQARERVRHVVEAVRSVNLRAVVAREAYTDEDVDFLWSLPQKVVPLLTGLRGESRPVPFVEDVAVPPESLSEFLRTAQRLFQKHQVTATLYAHAASGQLHLRPFLRPPAPPDGRLLQAISGDLYQAAIAAGGTISGEHGDGVSRTAFVRDQYGPLYDVFRQVKTIFDPHNLMNPGKIVGGEPRLPVHALRPAVSVPAELVDLKLRWSGEEMALEAARCNGCGRCRTQAPDMRMCPFFRIDASERASPRSKANAVRNFAGGPLDPLEFSSQEMKRLAELCFNCKQCRLECPSNIDVPHLMIEARAANIAANGIGRADWALSRVHSLGALGSTAAVAANWMIGSHAARWLLEKLLGIDRRRKLPRLSRRSFLRSMDRDCRIPPNRLGRDVPSVVYFVGEYANYYDPQLAHAFVSLMKHNGWHVYVPPEQTASGMAMVSAGDLDAARELAETNVRVLAEAAREGVPVVCTEPSSALALKEEYPMLLDDPDVQTVARQTVEAGALLARLHAEGRLRTQFAPLELVAGYHTPCHLKALGGGTPLLELMSLIPGLEVRRIEEGCSGMAGAFGLTRENFATSINIGWGLISRMRAGDLHVGLTECCSCKFQMEQGTVTPTLHPLKLMALACGLMPEIRKKLKPNKHKLVVS